MPGKWVEQKIWAKARTPEVFGIEMIQYVARRLLLAVPVLLGILFVTFAMARVIPGDPCRAVLGEHATDQVCDAFMERYGLNKPIPEQFVIYLGDVLKGDLGVSTRFGRPVTEIMTERLPVTVELALSALIFATTFGIITGIISAYWRNSPVDVLTMVGANFGVSIPVFVLGLLLAYFFSITLKNTPFALPPSGRLTAGMDVPSLVEVWNVPEDSAVYGLVSFLSNLYIFNGVVTGNLALAGDAAKHLILPTIALGTIPLALIARITRSSLLDVLGLDYTRTARAKGLTERLVVFRHAFRNALLPIVTVVGLSLGALLGGAVLTETVFGLTGVGRTLYDAITSRDYILVQTFTLIIAIGYVVVNLIVDLSYGYLDPRIRLK
jgi:peptide/nickel transport system permease protein